MYLLQSLFFCIFNFCIHFFIIHHACIFYRKSFLFQNILHCFSNRNSRIIINAAIQFQIIFIIECIIITIFYRLNCKILISNLVCYLCIMHCQTVSYLFKSIVYLRIQPSFHFLAIINQCIYSILTLNKIKTTSQRCCIFNSKSFHFMIRQRVICSKGSSKILISLDLHPTFCCQIFDHIILVNIMIFWHFQVNAIIFSDFMYLEKAEFLFFTPQILSGQCRLPCICTDWLLFHDFHNCSVC